MSHFSKIGPPPPKPHTSYGVPKPQYQPPQLKPYYGPPLKPAVSFKPPQQTYGVPQQTYGVPQQTYGLPPAPIRQPIPAYGPPTIQLQQNLPSYHQIPSYPAHVSHGPSFPQPIKGAGCDGWKPIPGPLLPSIGSHQAFANSNTATIESIGNHQAFANSNTATIESIAPENNYLPPVSNSLTIETISPENSYLPPASSNSLPVADTTLTVQPLPTNLQLPAAEASNFHNDANSGSLGADIASGLGLTSFNIVKSEGIEVCLRFFFLEKIECKIAFEFGQQLILF